MEYMLVHAHSRVCKPFSNVALARRVRAEPAAADTRAVDRAMLVGMPNVGVGYGPGKTAVV